MEVLDHVDRDKINELVERDEFFWLDLNEPSDEQLDELGEVFGLHAMAIEDSREFGQRPKLDEYGDTVLLVFYGVHHADNGDADPVEVHLHISGKWVVTVRHEPCAQLSDMRERMEARSFSTEELVIYRLLDGLTDSYFPLLEKLDDKIDELEDAMIDRPSQEQLQELFSLKKELVVLRRIVTPQRDLLASGGDLIDRLPGLSSDDAHDYFRDVYDHLIRISDLIDSYRDLLSGALDVYLSTQSNRMNAVMKQLTIIATIFLPLTFVTGFFGQNFGWLVDHIKSDTSFILYGGGGLIVPCVLLYVWFKRSGFFDP